MRCVKGIPRNNCPRNPRLGCDCGWWKPLLNWVKVHTLGSRNRPLHWIHQGEDYYEAVKRVYLESLSQIGFKHK